jgi:asparagine synthase (glutamine-hydrolysing)
MCGLSGVVALRADLVQPDAIDRLHAQIQARGPDGEGFYREPGLALAHRRLAIIDTTTAANQPFLWRDRYVLVFNGEIYNYRELRDELEAEGVCFRTASDTEVLIAAYAHWGEACQYRFNGMWAFVIWDRQTKQLFCSRDRFGVKPLYWAEHDQQLFLASEPKQLRALGLGGQVNPEELSRFLFAGIVGATPASFFAGIQSLPAGHCLTVAYQQPLRIERWYSLPTRLVDANAIPSLLRDSVALRLRSDVPVGSCLSGGLDSSAVVMLAAGARNDHLADQLRCIHARSSDPEVDESSFASLVADASGSHLLTLTPSADQFWQNLSEICRIQDEPFGSPSICMQYFVMQQARASGCPVMLDGQGADEILLGYSKFMVLAITHAWRCGGLPQLLRTLINSWSANASLTPRTSLQYLVGTLLSPLRAERVRRRLPFLKLSLEPVRHLYGSVAAAATDCRRTQLLELFQTSLPGLLRYEDRNSMAHSVEARLPFLDYRLVEAALALPVDQKIHNGWSKYPLRTSGILPDAIAWRRSKLGFNAPERSWIGGYSRQMLAQTLDSPLIAAIADRAALERSWPRLDRREQWRLFNVALWADIYRVRL